MGRKERRTIRATISSGSAQLAETYFRLDTGQTLFGLNRRCGLGVLSCLEWKTTSSIVPPTSQRGSSIRHLVHDARNDGFERSRKLSLDFRAAIKRTWRNCR